jgi:hypothetical protein
MSEAAKSKKKEKSLNWWLQIGHSQQGRWTQLHAPRWLLAQAPTNVLD